MVFQDPISSLNPVVPIGVQVTEVLLAHTKVTKKQAKAEAVDLLRRAASPNRSAGSRSIRTSCREACDNGR